MYSGYAANRKSWLYEYYKIKHKNPSEMIKKSFFGGFIYADNFLFYLCYHLIIDPAQHNTKDQHQKAHRNIKIFTHRVKIFREWFLAAFVDLAFHIAPAEDPEEHDPASPAPRGQI